MTARGGDLTGVRVVAVEQAVAAPLCSRHLGDLGADVIKIERPGEGDFARGYDEAVYGEATHFVWLNRGKRSVVLDLKSESGRRTLRALLAQADVLVCNLAPGAMERIVPDAELTVLNPRLIRCYLSGYGDTGPYAGRKAYDALVQGRPARSPPPAPRKHRPNPVSRWPTSPAGPTRWPRSSPRCTPVSTPASASGWTSRCSTCSWSG